jgi:hypothetical protein
MSLQTSRFSLLFLSLLALASCEEPGDIGLNLPGQNAVGTSYDKSRTITASTIVQPDSILAFQSNPIMVGQTSDGELGEVSAGQYTEVGLNGTAVEFDVTTGAQADSLVLVLAYSGYYNGDTTANLTVNVNRLSENFVDNNTYYTNTVLTAPDLLGSKTFKPKYYRTNLSAKTGKSTKYAFSRMARIPLTTTATGKAFADELLHKSFSSQEDFRLYWKGIVISATGKSIVGFHTLPDSAGNLLGRVAGINLYFTDKSGKHLVHNFALSGTYYYNSIKGNRTGVLNLKKGEEALATLTNNITYTQENTGVKTRLTFPDLSALKPQQGKIYVNHADLIVPVKPGTINDNGKVNKAPEAIYLYESTPGKRVSKSILGVSFAVQQGNSSPFGLSSPNRALYVADSGFYKADVTSYIQALLDNRKTNNGIIVSPQAEDLFTKKAALGTSAAFPGTITVNRALLNPAKMQLRIYYSLIN